MSRKVKFSKNWYKAKNHVAKIHQKIANIRKDFLHKTTTTLSKNHALIVIEDLDVNNMCKSIKNNKSKAKSRLNKSILEQGWFEFRRQLEYKQQWRGGLIQIIKPQYTSQKCSCCGYIDKENRRTQAKFECVRCNYKENADLNAAHNILAAGLAVLACGEMTQLGHSVKQEPTEDTILDF